MAAEGTFQLPLGLRPWTPGAQRRRPCLAWRPQGSLLARVLLRPRPGPTQLRWALSFWVRPRPGPTRLCWGLSFWGPAWLRCLTGAFPPAFMWGSSGPSRGPFSMSPGRPVASTSSQQPWQCCVGSVVGQPHLLENLLESRTQPCPVELQAAAPCCCVWGGGRGQSLLGPAPSAGGMLWSGSGWAWHSSAFCGVLAGDNGQQRAG